MPRGNRSVVAANEVAAELRIRKIEYIFIIAKIIEDNLTEDTTIESPEWKTMMDKFKEIYELCRDEENID